MLLTVDSVMRTVFLIFGAFWVTVLLILLLGVGALLKKRDRLLEKSGQGHAGPSH